MADTGRLPPELIPGFHDDRSGLVVFCVVFCLVVATAMVCLRIWTRAFILKKVGADDWAAIIALVCYQTINNNPPSDPLHIELTHTKIRC